MIFWTVTGACTALVVLVLMGAFAFLNFLDDHSLDEE